MKLTKSKLEQLIREALAETKMDFSWGTNPPPDTSTPSGQADYEDWERSARAAERREEEDEEDEVTLPLPLDSDEYDVATAALQYAMHYHPYPEEQLHSPPWAKAVYHVIDSQFGEEDWSPTPGGRHPIEISEPSLKTLNWALNIRELPGWLEDNEYIDDGAMAALPAIKEKVQSLLAGEEKQPEQEPEPKPEQEPEVPEDERIDPRFAHLEFDEALRRQQKGQNTMKLTKNTLKQLIKEEMENLGAGKAVPVEDLSWGNNERGEMRVSSAAGEDHWTKIKTPEAFEEWKTAVLSHGPGSTTFINKYGRWVPASGPWKEKSDAYTQGKAQALARWGSSH